MSMSDLGGNIVLETISHTCTHGLYNHNPVNAYGSVVNRFSGILSPAYPAGCDACNSYSTM